MVLSAPEAEEEEEARLKEEGGIMMLLVGLVALLLLLLFGARCKAKLPFLDCCCGWEEEELSAPSTEEVNEEDGSADERLL